MSDKEKISPVHCIHYIPRINLEDGGVIRFVLDICSVLASQGMKVTLVSQDGKDIPSDWLGRDDRPEVMILDQRALPGGLLTKKNLNKIAALLDSNTVISLHVPWLLSNYQVARMAVRYGVPYVVTPHGSLDVWSMQQKSFKKKIFWRLFGSSHYQKASCIHFTAASEREQALPYIGNTHSSIIPCLFDTQPYADLPDKSLALDKYAVISQTKPNLLFLSRLHPKKGTDILIDAARILQNRNFDFNIIVAGPEDDLAKGYQKNIEDSIANYGLQDKVHLIGMISGEDKLSLYRVCDLFVLPTHQENFGFVLVEAMACGTPVLTSFGVDIWKEIQKAGASIVNNAAIEVADEIIKLLNDPLVLLQTGERSRTWIFDELAPEKIASEYFSMYLNIAQQ